jgi:DNA-binding MarR family transcriptional regulator
VKQESRPLALQTWSDLNAVAALTRGAVNRSLQRTAGLTLAENLVLCHVAMSPDAALRMADLAATLGVAKSAVTKIVDRLEVRGWLRRAPDTTDRRSVHAVLTADGATVFARVRPAFEQSVADQLGRLSTAELTELCGLLDKVRKGAGRVDSAASPETNRLPA